jgi:hypothetical protein
MEEVYQAAHRLKNTVMYLGSQPTIDALNRLEQAAESGSHDAVSQALKELELQLENLKKALLVYRENAAMRPGI